MSMVNVLDTVDEVVAAMIAPVVYADTADPVDLPGFSYPVSGDANLAFARVMGMTASGRVSTAAAASGDLTVRLLLDGVAVASIVLSPTDGLADMPFMVSAIMTVRDAGAEGEAVFSLATASPESTLSGMDCPAGDDFDGTVPHTLTLEVQCETADADNTGTIEQLLFEVRKSPR